MPGTGGGVAGDLLLKITVGEKPGWTRKGMDVYSDVEVPFTTPSSAVRLLSTRYMAMWSAKSKPEPAPVQRSVSAAKVSSP